jgi:hypothetical protein
VSTSLGEPQSTAVDDGIDRMTAKIGDVMSASVAERFRHHAYAIRNNPLPVLAAIVSFVVVIRLSRRRGGR